MAAADYRIMTDATGQRIATALEAQSIDKAAKADLTSIIATGTTNTTGATITAGTYFYLNGTLVQAKAAIASGASFTSGTNYEAVTAGGLNSLNDKIITMNAFALDLPSGYSDSYLDIFTIGRMAVITGRIDLTTASTAKTITLSNVIPATHVPLYNYHAVAFNNATDRPMHAIVSNNSRNILFYRNETENLTAIALTLIYFLSV